MNDIKRNVVIIASLMLIITLNFSCSKVEEPCVKKTWYRDVDGDGKGNKASSFDACEQPIGYVSNADDDNDGTAQGTSIIPTRGYTSASSYPDMKLLWSDEFEGTSLNEKFWNYEIGNGNDGWGNKELQYYKKENTSVKDGYLIIEAKRETAGNQNYTSSRLTTQDKFNFKYGRIDIRAALPKGQGIWPALWMLGKNIPQVSWPKCGEIDIMEMIGGNESGAGSDRTTYGTVHWDNNGQYAQYGGNTKLTSGTFNDEFHVFSITWDAKKIVWYLDNKQFHVIDTTPAALSEFQEEYFLLVNLAVGGNWPKNPDGTTTFPQYFVVDYIRVFQ